LNIGANVQIGIELSLKQSWNKIKFMNTSVNGMVSVKAGKDAFEEVWFDTAVNSDQEEEKEKKCDTCGSTVE
jgi:hypothetical protein